jgi:hypothetical protein
MNVVVCPDCGNKFDKDLWVKCSCEEKKKPVVKKEAKK